MARSSDKISANDVRSYWVHASAVERIEGGPYPSFHWSQLVTDTSYVRNANGKRDGQAVEVHLINLATYGDYDNSCQIERSNQRVMLADDDMRPHLFHVFGSYGSSALGFVGPLDECPEPIAEAICAMAVYPVLDDSDESELEMAVEAEAWAEAYGGRFNFRKELGAWLDACDPGHEHDTDRLDDDTIDALWYAGVEAWRGGESCSHESGGNVYFDLDGWLGYRYASPRGPSPRQHTLQQLYAGAYYEGPTDIAERARVPAYIVPGSDGVTDCHVEVALTLLSRAVVALAKEVV
jgi:hypothetical protein